MRRRRSEIKNLALFLMLFLIGGCSFTGIPGIPQTAEEIGCAPEIDHAAMVEAEKVLGDHPSSMSVWEGPDGALTVDRYQHKLDDFKKWKSENVHDQCESAAYDHWLWFFQYETDEARSELKTHRSQNDYSSTIARWDEERRRQEQWDRDHKITSPNR